jgi:hypothetical protein
MTERAQVAYFPMEIALESSMPTYSGGLGVLAGDTIRSAADLEVPMVAVTLLHREETVSLFGIPVITYIDIDDSEADLGFLSIDKDRERTDLLTSCPLLWHNLSHWCSSCVGSERSFGKSLCGPSPGEIGVHKAPETALSFVIRRCRATQGTAIAVARCSEVGFSNSL